MKLKITWSSPKDYYIPTWIFDFKYYGKVDHWFFIVPLVFVRIFGLLICLHSGKDKK